MASSSCPLIPPNLNQRGVLIIRNSALNRKYLRVVCGGKKGRRYNQHLRNIRDNPRKSQPPWRDRSDQNNRSKQSSGSEQDRRFVRKSENEVGIVPRSILRTASRFQAQLLGEDMYIQEYNAMRNQIQSIIRVMVGLIATPFIINFVAGHYFVTPMMTYFWNTQSEEIFLNETQQERALKDLEIYDEIEYFERIIDLFPDEKVLGKAETGPGEELQMKKLMKKVSVDVDKKNKQKKQETSIIFISQNSAQTEGQKKVLLSKIEKKADELVKMDRAAGQLKRNTLKFVGQSYNKNIEPEQNYRDQIDYYPDILDLADRTQDFANLDSYEQMGAPDKYLKLAEQYNQESIECLSTVVTDLTTIIVWAWITVTWRPQMMIIKSILVETAFGLEDTTKAFLLILGSDLFVGFHSSSGWEIFLSALARHFGLPEDHDLNYLFVATFPVILDTGFKYFVFRYLNRVSPSTVVTYYAMVE